jgi:hypothetical protein
MRNRIAVLLARVAKGLFSSDRKHWLSVACLFTLLLLTACRSQGESGMALEATAPAASSTEEVLTPEVPFGATERPQVPLADISLAETDVAASPLPLRAASPFTITAVIQNNRDVLVQDVPLMVYISAKQEQIGYQPFAQLLTVTLPPTQAVPVKVPVNWNFAGGEHQLWIQVNRLPESWQDRAPTLPESNMSDNVVLRELMIDPFDAYASDLCSGRVDVGIGPSDVLPEPDRQRVLVRVHNLGNRAVYNLPVVVLGDQLGGIAYTPVIPPCGGTIEVYVEVDRPFQQGESLTVQVNPGDWMGELPEDNVENNLVTVAAGLAPDMTVLPGGGLDDYDFRINATDIESPELYIVLVTVHNLGTRDASMVPIRIENEAGRKITDSIPLVQGNGLGVAAFRVGYLWTQGDTLTFVVNPEDTEGSFPESNRENNVATFTLP